MLWSLLIFWLGEKQVCSLEWVFDSLLATDVTTMS